MGISFLAECLLYYLFQILKLWKIYVNEIPSFEDHNSKSIIENITRKAYRILVQMFKKSVHITFPLVFFLRAQHGSFRLTRHPGFVIWPHLGSSISTHLALVQVHYQEKYNLVPRKSTANDHTTKVFFFTNFPPKMFVIMTEICISNEPIWNNRSITHFHKQTLTK